MNDTTNNEQRIEDDEEATSNTAGIRNSNRNNIADSIGNPLQVGAFSTTNTTATTTEHITNLEDEEEQVVTSTSSESSGNTPRHQTNVTRNNTLTLHNLITSPARITSSTGNDYSSSPTQAGHTRDESSAHAILSSEDDSLEQQQAAVTLATRRIEAQQHELNASMPTTSAAAAATLRTNNTKTDSIENLCNHLTTENRDSRTASSINSSSSSSNNSSNSNRNLSINNSNTSENMVARESGSNLTVGCSSGNEPVGAQVEKIILKLPKPTSSAHSPNTNESQKQQQQHQDKLVDIDPTMSNSCSNSSTNSSIAAEPDTRKVEPLKINLHHSASHHHHHQHHSPSGSGSSINTASGGINVVPKITIKPLIKKSESAVVEEQSSDKTASSNQEAPIPKLTIKACNLNSSVTASDCSNNEPHIVPKLTIRAAHEDGGGTLTSVVPKLTIKMSDSQSTSHSSLHNSVHSPTPPTKTNTLNELQTQQQQQPPLPKLTIKTTLDGASGSSILCSSISPALSSSNSSSSAASSPQNAAALSITSSSSSSTSSVVGSGSGGTVPKLTIKNLTTKSHEDHPALPKLTIKTSATGSCVSTTAMNPTELLNDVKMDTVNVNSNTSHTAATTTKIPKLTIKTGQEHAVIITQHNNDQTIPKLTIKTKSIETEESQHSDVCSDDAAAPPEKIPKLTIKASSLETTSSSSSCIPKLTISTPNSPKSHHNAPLVVRQLPHAVTSPYTTSKTQSPERVPKLMISRQDIAPATSNNCTIEATTSEKLVPKLTIKTTTTTNEQRHEEFKEKSEKVPKLTIKTIQPTQQSSEDSDDALSIESSSPTPQQNKLVPKLTIKNLASPKLKLKSVMEDVPSKNEKFHDAAVSATPPPSSTLRNTSPPATQVNEIKMKANEEIANTNVVALVNGGESSSSQEFCGFTDNTTTTSTPTATPTLMNEIAVSKADVIASNDLQQETTEPRRNSDDMDIDEDVKQHDPKMFNNITHFANIRNGESYGIHLDNNIDALPVKPIINSINQQKVLDEKPPTTDIVDTVDLTSSPSPAASPAHFNYTDAEQKTTDFSQLASYPGLSAPNALLMECLQREKSVIHTAPSATSGGVGGVGPKANSNSLLLSQLTAPLRQPPPPPLLPRPPPHLLSASQCSLRYPQLTERLLANGAHMPIQAIPQQQQQPIRNLQQQILPPTEKPPPLSNVIDSIEILDTPEGSPRSSQESDSQPATVYNNVNANVTQQIYTSQTSPGNVAPDLLRHNNNIVHTAAEATNFNHHNKRSSEEMSQNCLEDLPEIVPHKIRRNNSTIASTMATLTILTNDKSTNSSKVITTSPTFISSVSDHYNSPKSQNKKSPETTKTVPQAQTPTPPHRSRKQKHENLLSLPIDELESVNATFGNDTKKNQDKDTAAASAAATAAAPIVTTPAAPIQKKRGRPRKIQPPPPPPPQTEECTPKPIAEERPNTPSSATNSSAAVRRVQLLRKRLAINMVDAETPKTVLEEVIESADAMGGSSSLEDVNTETPRRERAVRATRRCGTPNATSEKLLTTASATKQQQQQQQQPQRKQRQIMNNTCELLTNSMSMSNFNHFGGSNSSISSACSSSSSLVAATTMLTTTATATSLNAYGSNNLTTTDVVLAGNLDNCNFSTMTNQIDLTISSMSSSSSMTSNNGNTTTATITMSEARTQKSVAAAAAATMLPPTKALSSTDPLPDVVFRSQDFSTILLTQQLQTSPLTSRLSSRENSQDSNEFNGSIGSGSGDDSNNSPFRTHTPGSSSGRERGRGRGRGRGTPRGGPHKAHRLGRGASAVAKQIAMNRPRHVGVLKHTPQPDRLKGLFSPSPQVFEEDTRMSADMSQMNSEPHTPIRQPDFLTNEDESQSSIISNTSILDPNTIAAVQGGASIKRVKKKKMEVCAADETEYLVSSIAEYDWPPPKGCCPSKNRDTFMIQEQVANYLGIKSFKRKYPDLPRRQIDMEERSWLQEKGLVTEKMCDLGITAVWASDILDIMYADFYDKYEEYKDYMRQKHLREIEAKQKALGLNVTGRGLQARDRAMLSASKWNTYFNRTRKDERTTCLDLQTLTVNVPLPTTVPATTIMHRPIAKQIAKAAKAEQISEPPTLLKPRELEKPFEQASYYPIAIVPGQYGELYRQYSPKELLAFPLNTALTTGLLNSKTTTAAATTAEETDSANETLSNCDRSLKRSKILRSRRARTERSSKRTCDIKTENENQTSVTNNESDLVKSDSESCSSTSSSSATSCSSSSCDDTSSCTSSDDEYDEDKTLKCNVCQQNQNRNLKDLPELFIKCYTCRRRVHPSCIEMPHRMVQRVRNYNWQCAECKCCIKCKRRRDTNKMLYCEQCDRGFHIYCLGVKTVPDGRWSCERCSVCMRCGATKPEGLPKQPEQQLFSPNGEKIKQIKHKKVKWINEYRIDHITKLREHCSMLCVPCGRNRTTMKRVQIPHHSQGNNNNNRNSSSNPGNNNAIIQNNAKSQMSPPVAPVSNNIAVSTAGAIVNSTNNAANGTNTAATTTNSTTPPPPPVVA